jgi:hypothetical protein
VVAPLAVQRVEIERYVWWMQEVRRFKPSTVSRRMAVVTGFYRTRPFDLVMIVPAPTIAPIDQLEGSS